MLTSYIPFTLTLSDGKILPMRDIFAFRNVLSSQFLDVALQYSIKSGDTPTSIAYYLYSSDRYEWIIYCLNSIVNPYYDWPLSEDDFYEMVSSKYYGKKCLFLELDSVTKNFIVGETVTSGSTVFVVEEWDRTLSKLTVKDIGENAVALDMAVIAPSGATGIVKRIVGHAEEAVHHFETSTGVRLDPYAGYLQAYINGSNEIYAITNKQFEEKVNDSKRQIYVLPPEHVRSAENLLVRNINQLAAYDVENILL